MKGEISNEGRLSISRSGKLKAQVCCHGDYRFCGDECPAFQEPIQTVDQKYRIKLCADVGMVYFYEFVDKRA